MRRRYGGRTRMKTLKDLRIEEELCEKLDSEVYLPVKQELKGINKTYSLGFRKEDFKGLIEKKLLELKQLAIKWIKEDIEAWKPEMGSAIGPDQRAWMERLNITREDLDAQELGGEE